MAQLTINEAREILKDVMNPELGVNVVDLGLIYSIDIQEDGIIQIEMTLTTPGCPLHDTIVSGVKSRLASHTEVNAVQVDLVWSPPWTPANMSADARAQLGY
jgi:metal-sulfur cluster biosynthetic enzyme